MKSDENPVAYMSNAELLKTFRLMRGGVWDAQARAVIQEIERRGRAI